MFGGRTFAGKTLSRRSSAALVGGVLARQREREGVKERERRRGRAGKSQTNRDRLEILNFD